MEQDVTSANAGEQPPIAHPPNSGKRIGGRFTGAIRQSLAMLFWTYTILKIFVFDIDIYLFHNLFPGYEWLLTYKFVILIGIIGAAWLMIGTREIIIWLLYIALYPFIVIFWKIPYFVLRQRSWTFAIALIDVVVSFFQSFKHTFITLSFLIVSATIIFTFSNEWLLWLSIVTLLVVNIVTYVYRLVFAFKPSSLYSAYGFVSSVPQNVRNSFQNLLSTGIDSLTQQSTAEVQPVELSKELYSLPVDSLDKTQRDQWISALQLHVFLNRAFLFGAKKLRDYQSSGMSIVFASLTIVFLIILTTLIFAIINYGLYKINKDLFLVSSAPTFFTFIYYSFNNFIINNAIQEIVPRTDISQAIRMMQGLFSLFIVVISVSLLIPATTQKHATELDKIVKDLDARGAEIESYIRDEFKINTIDDAMAELAKLEAVLAKFLYSMSERIR
jgi:hypothetical protein